MLDALCIHYHEHYDALLRLGWPLFCARWARMLTQVEEQRRDRLRREEERQRDADMRKLREAHEQAYGGGSRYE